MVRRQRVLGQQQVDPFGAMFQMPDAPRNALWNSTWGKAAIPAF